jgi:hypothetical protein
VLGLSAPSSGSAVAAKAEVAPARNRRREGAGATRARFLRYVDITILRGSGFVRNADRL